MDQKTLTALQGSIEKWERIVAGTDIDRGGENCPLCKEFADEVDPVEDSFCYGCPVSAAVGQSECGGTPYAQFAQLVPWIAFGESRGRATTPEQIAAAQAELDFLKGLLPQESESAANGGPKE